MALPFELTTLPNGSLDVISFLFDQDGYAAYDGAIIEATGLSDRGFGKVIRRLVTREYVEMQYDGSYQLTEMGVEAAEIVAVHAEEEQAARSFEEDGEPADEDDTVQFEMVSRPVLVIYPKALTVGQPGFLFVRVDEAPPGGEAPVPVDLLFRMSGECDIFPEQGDVTVPEQEPAQAVRFEVTPAMAGSVNMRVEAFHVTQMDLVAVGALDLALTAVDLAASDRFLVKKFEITYEPGI